MTMVMHLTTRLMIVPHTTGPQLWVNKVVQIPMEMVGQMKQIHATAIRQFLLK